MNREIKQRGWRLGTLIRLLFAGWRPDRDVWSRLNLPRHLPAFPEAKRVLARFGNLRFGGNTDYVLIDPSIGGEDLTQEFELCEKGIGCRLYPVGVWSHQDEIYLVIDEAGHVYTLMGKRKHQQLEMCELEPLASSFERAIEFFIRRYKRGIPSEVQEDLRRHGIECKLWQFYASQQLASDPAVERRD